MKFRVFGPGCKANRYDARRLAALLSSAGWQEADPQGPVDLAVVFGCVVTGTAEAKTRRLVGKALSDASRVVVAGCAGRMWKDCPEPCTITPERDAVAIAHMLGIPDVDAPVATGSSDRTRAVIKVQEGCPAGCSYCIVPKVRPGSVSVAPEAILAEAKAAAANGVPEIVITGVHTGLYGADIEGAPDLAALLSMMLKTLAGYPVRIRLSSVEPMEVTAALVEVMAGSAGRIAPFVHLPLQSGDNEVLKNMNRPYSVEDYMETVNNVRSAMPLAGIGMDVMVGFPGETDEAFENTLQVVYEIQPVRVHVFTYSERPGTAAAEMEGSVSARERRERSHAADATARSASMAYAVSMTGRTVEVIPEGDALESGYTGEYASIIAARPFSGGGLRKAVVLSAAEAGQFPAATVLVEEA
ncbi:MAG: MiaB/RimO family radical SAM methylthiotransferase [Planctomycetes bacterium]|nr:MiaB/RimO family radical SAM methylthiotransferase [Planctomycetota bacterium]